MLKIVSYGGIGDTIRNLGRTPHTFLYRTFGMPSTVIHINSRIIGSFEYTHPPKPEFVEALIKRCPSLRWGGEVVSSRQAGVAADKILRESLRFLNGGQARYFPFEFTLTPEELASIRPPPGACMGIQTHLSGMKTKKWGLDRWKKFLELLIEKYPEASFVLLDTDPEAEKLVISERISTTLGYNLAQSIHLFRYFSFLISIDSWTKYVAAWRKIPQVIIAPDVQSEYIYSTPHQLLRSDFLGIFGHASNLVIGLDRDPQGNARHTLNSMDDLTPEYLAKQVDEHLQTLSRQNRSGRTLLPLLAP
jgi:hypothetical protein